tara:strand:- start:41 stop:247 length:207 start_codon:yes stop_codon:yes gene_type:complete
MKNVFSSVKNRMVARYILVNRDDNLKKSTDINILLNRVKLDKKRESRKKIIFSAAASAGVILFGVLIF